ncbi:tyrosine-type recombinase/integrase [Terrabacter sp. Ter38]|uniref:tyrosine-type recombinase/integrase n=1 Tax=Terrabacter sp. Ter38 TaxID=2926030 RepID=UPI002119B3D9|nr:tyrosine-type recombinase/integrase [Terrabacter sp. Ter38]
MLPITEDQLAAIVAHMPRRHQALVILAAGTGLQQGEIFGLTVDRLDLERRNVLVDRQLINFNGRELSSATQVPGQPPRRPLPGVVADALQAHLEAYPATALVFTNNVGAPLRRSAFWTEWNRALKQAGIPAIGFHELRHYYASLLVRHGESVKTVQGAVDGVLRDFADSVRTNGGDQTHHRSSEA